MTTVLRGVWSGALELLLSALVLLPAWGRAETATLKNGMTVEGSFFPTGSVTDLSAVVAAAVPQKPIVVFDDQLRRVFVPKNQIVGDLGTSPAISQEKITLSQPVGGGHTIYGPLGRIDPFDEHGRRIITVATINRGIVPVIQGITEITPKVTKLEALRGFQWQMRIATSSIPREQLSKVLLSAIDPLNPDHRLRIVRLYLQAERFQEAREELDQLLKDFPTLDLKDQQKTLRQLGAQRLVKEIELRRETGQYRLVRAMLEQFPSEGVAGETLLKVRELLDEFAAIEAQGAKVLKLLDEHAAALKANREIPALKAILAEIKHDLNANTLDRMADYLRLADDAAQSAEQKLSLAISGWLLGSGSGVENLAISTSLIEVRNLVRKYLASTRQADRDQILAQLTSLEGATPEYIAKLIAQMPPPLAGEVEGEKAADLADPAAVLGGAPQPAKSQDQTKADEKAQPAPSAPKGGCGSQEGDADLPASAPDGGGAKIVAPKQAVAGDQPPGLLEQNTMIKELIEDPRLKYWIQLPPDYDPYRRYPCIVTLNGTATTPLQQIDWWAGSYDPQAGTRYGQATRHGYIVLAPQWTREHQRSYGYSAREHAVVIRALQHAIKRFAIDTDRVFLSGHSIGGDAAWDIGLAHPDLWAGIIPIVATAEKYVKHKYQENAKCVPLYFVCGERDGNKMKDNNGSEFDHYLKHTGYDTMVVQYQGRGHEHFHDEVQNLFTWMNLHKRDFFPKDFTVYSMRPWDRSFWWIELDQPLDANMVLPAEWGTKPHKASQIEVRTVAATNGVNVSTGGWGKVTIWLSPEIVSFANRVPVTVNGKALTVNGKRPAMQPSVTTLLEDVRARGDRQHPFWAKVEN